MDKIIHKIKGLFSYTQSSFQCGRYWEFVLGLLAALTLISLPVLALSGLFNGIRYIFVEIKKEPEAWVTFFIILGFCMVPVVKRILNHFNSEPIQPVDYDVEDAEREKSDASDTYETMIIPNLVPAINEIAVWLEEIIPVNDSTIRPPKQSEILDKKSHVFYVVFVRTQNDIEPIKVSNALTDIITQRRKAGQLVNMDVDTVADDKGIGRSRILIDSVVKIPEGLLIYCALASPNYFLYRQSQIKRAAAKSPIFNRDF